MDMNNRIVPYDSRCSSPKKSSVCASSTFPYLKDAIPTMHTKVRPKSPQGTIGSDNKDAVDTHWHNKYTRLRDCTRTATKPHTGVNSRLSISVTPSSTPMQKAVRRCMQL